MRYERGRANDRQEPLPLLRRGHQAHLVRLPRMPEVPAGVEAVREKGQAMIHTYKLHGQFKPYTRRTYQGKKSQRAQEYHASQNAIRLQFQNQMQINGWEMLPERTPLFVGISIKHNSGWHNRDIDNELKAILDAAQGVVFKDDCWIDLIICSRMAHPDAGITVRIGTV